MKAKLILLIILIGLPYSVFGQGLNRISNITTVEGEQNNNIQGFGLITGLVGTGDQGDSDKIKAELALLKNIGVDVTESDITSKNVAYVAVTGVLKPHMKKGQIIEVIVSSKGSAKSIRNGQLLSTLLYSPYLGISKVFAIASGPIRVDEKSPNTGTVQAVIEEEVPVSFFKKEGDELVFYLILNDPNFANTSTIANDINLLYGNIGGEGESSSSTISNKLAKAIDAAKVRVIVPPKVIKSNDTISFIADIQKITITDYTPAARVLVNSRNGTVIISGPVTMEPVAIAHNDLVIKIEDTRNPNNQVDKSLASLPGGSNLDSLVKSLNMLGVKPMDLIIILEKLHKQGALHAKLEID
jgi:flagellar P-ring protein precursor FlgI